MDAIYNHFYPSALRWGGRIVIAQLQKHFLARSLETTKAILIIMIIDH